ncbi:MAG: hypothetical protein ACTHN5_23035 [Phycisphaerae bacterium]
MNKLLLSLCLLISAATTFSLPGCAHDHDDDRRAYVHDHRDDYRQDYDHRDYDRHDDDHRDYNHHDDDRH